MNNTCGAIEPRIPQPTSLQHPYNIPTTDMASEGGAVIEGEYVWVSDREGGEVVELPTENDGSLLLTTLRSQFSLATGLRFRASDPPTTSGASDWRERAYSHLGELGVDRYTPWWQGHFKVEQLKQFFRYICI